MSSKDYDTWEDRADDEEAADEEAAAAIVAAADEEEAAAIEAAAAAAIVAATPSTAAEIAAAIEAAAAEAEADMAAEAATAEAAAAEAAEAAAAKTKALRLDILSSIGRESLVSTLPLPDSSSPTRSRDRDRRSQKTLDRNAQHCCKQAENNAYDGMEPAAKAALNDYHWIRLRSDWDVGRQKATVYIICYCYRSCRERYGPAGGVFGAYCDGSPGSIQRHLMDIDAIVKCETDDTLVLVKNLVDHVKGLDPSIPKAAGRVYYCSGCKRYHSFPHKLHCEDCGMGFATSTWKDRHYCHAMKHRKGSSKGSSKGDTSEGKVHVRGGRPSKVDDFPHLVDDFPHLVAVDDGETKMGETGVIVARDTGAKSAATSGDHTILKIVGPDGLVEVCPCGKVMTVSRTVYAKMICDTGLVDDATKTGFATGIENKYARCWDCQCSYNGSQQQMLPPAGPPQMAAPQMQMQMLAPQYMLPPATEGHKWCMASVPVMVMTGNGPQFLMQQNFVLVRC
jgi:hypothetical protein